MLKPDSLRAALTAAIVDGAGVRLLERDPDQLHIFIDKGRLVAHLGPSLGYEYRYRLSMVLVGYTGHPDAVVFTVLNWIRVNQPDLLQNRDRAQESIGFEAVIVDDKTVDMEIQLELTETVRATPKEGGGYDLEHLVEPPLEELLAGAPAGTLLHRVYTQGELIAGEA